MVAGQPRCPGSLGHAARLQADVARASRRYLGSRRRRRGDGRFAGQHRSAAGKSHPDSERGGKRIKRLDQVAAAGKAERTGCNSDSRQDSEDQTQASGQRQQGESKARAGTGNQRDSVWPGWPGQRAVRVIQREWRERRFWISGGRRRLRQQVCLVCQGRAGQNYGELAQVRNRSQYSQSQSRLLGI